jgi:adenylate cyclase
MERRLAAILSADVVGYSRLMGEDEAGTLAALKTHRKELIVPKEAQYHGRTIKLMGDGVLMEFSSVVDAVQFAVEIQLAMRERNLEVPEDRQIVYRIGINVGDVIVEDDDIYGDGVNVAARLEGLAEPGGICVRRNVRNQVRDKLDLEFEDMGDVEVKNIARPVRVFQVVLDENAAALVTPVVAAPARFAPSKQRWIAAALAAGLGAVGGLVWWQPWAPETAPISQESARLPLPDKPSIVVLPFANMGGDPEQEYFADGMTDDLITDLSKLSGLFVISRNSAFTYKAKAVNVPDVARELGVRYVLEGSVRRQGETVRINAQLIDGTTGGHVWADRYDGTFDDIFTLQDKVIGQIVAELKIKLTKTEEAQISRIPTSNLEAYDYFLRGEKLAYLADPTSANDALRFYQRAIGLDQGFADAYAGYARTATDVFTYGYADSLPAAVARKRAYEAAGRALTLNPRLARGYSVLALLQMLDSRHEAALTSAHKAVTLSPNSAEAHLNLAVVLVYGGRPDEALHAMERVLRLNPKPPSSVYDYYGLILYMNRLYDQALAALEHGGKFTNSDIGLQVLTAVNVRMGRMDAAKAAVQSILERWPDENLAWYEVLYAHYAREEDRAEFIEALRLAGVPEWPRGFEGDPKIRLSGEAIDALIDGRTWTGERVGLGAFIQFIQEDGAFIERGPDDQFVGTATRQGDLLCMQSPAILLGRKHCGPIFQNPSGTRENQDEYIYPNAYRLKRFSATP